MLSEKKFRIIYDDFVSSGLTIRDYCSNQEINEATFYYWQHNLKGSLPPKKGFLPVVIEKGLPGQQMNIPVSAQKQQARTDHVNRNISCEITYPNGISLKLNNCADFELIRSLLLLAH